MTYSRNARLYPFETDPTEAALQNRNPGYLPITQVLGVILNAGYTGYISFEVFNRSLNQPGENVVREHAERARVSWERCKTYIDNHSRTKQVVGMQKEGLVTDDVDTSYGCTIHPQQQMDLRTRDGEAEYVGVSPRL